MKNLFLLGTVLLIALSGYGQKKMIQPGQKLVLMKDSMTAGDFLTIANTKYKHRDYYGAIADYAKAIELDPKNVDAYYYSGLAKVNLHNFVGAIVDYTKAIEINPKSANTFYNRGNAKHELHDYTGAIADFTKAIEINPKLRNAYYNRGISKMSIGHKNSGCKDFRKAGEMGDADAYELIKKFCQ